jgi:Surface antigen variable number repeat
MKGLRVLITPFLLSVTVFCQTTATSSPAPDLAQYRLEVVIFVGGRSLSAEQLRDAFNIHVGDKFNQAAENQGLERLRQLYGDHGYLNFAVVPELQFDKSRSTVVLRINIDEGGQFTFGQLIPVGQETRAGEAANLRNAPVKSGFR